MLIFILNINNFVILYSPKHEALPGVIVSVSIDITGTDPIAHKEYKFVFLINERLFLRDEPLRISRYSDFGK